MSNIKQGEASLGSPKTPPTRHTHILLHEDGTEVMTIVSAQLERRRGSGQVIASRRPPESHGLT